VEIESRPKKPQKTPKLDRIFVAISSVGLYNKRSVPVLNKILGHEKILQEGIKMSRMFFAAVVIGGLVLSSISFGYSGGTGTAEDPYQIADVNDLLALAADANDYGKCFILTADIDMDGQEFTTAIIAANTRSDSFFEGPVFAGTFDGKGYRVTHFTINGGTGSHLGLFGYIGSSGSIKNLGLENCAVSGCYYVGDLVGYNGGGNISNCYSTGSVSGSSGSYYIGGLAGSSHGSISNCYSEGPVSGSSSVGGLVGVNDSSISNCYSTGTVSGSLEVGGLVGYNMFGSISNCYSTGAVSGASVGGLVGFNVGSIIGCYSTGAVSGTTHAGGLVGYNLYSYGNVIGSFWDTQTSGRTTSDGGIGKTTAQMKTLSTFTSAGWDFVEIWGIGENQTYPYLRTELAGDLNHDKKVDFADFAILASHWLEGM
jgi:hypothetical protein